MRRVYLSAGHTNIAGLDQGAFNYNHQVTEGSLTVELRDKVATLLRANGVEIVLDENKNALIETLRFFRRMVTPRDLAIDIHFNSGGAGARGVEVIIPKQSSPMERSTASSLAINISSVLGTQNRGVKSESDTPHKRLGWMRMNCENILIEICFISNQIDYDKYISYKDEVAKMIAEILTRAANNI